MKNKGEYYCSLNFPFKYLLCKELSEMYQSLGMFMSAYELLQDVELNEDAIKCLYMGGRQTDAIKKADALLEKYKKSGTKGTMKYANLLCMLGDIKKEPEQYELAWLESN